MACYHPLSAYRARGGGISFGGRSAFVDLPLVLPCGQCIGCRLERSRQWAVRCMHEASLHEANCFVTLTYAEAPVGLVKQDHVKFMKRLRRKVGKRISFFLCGEYGETFARPHFHALIFGWWPKDAVPWKKSGDGSQLYTSVELEKIWGKGFCSVGAVTFESAAYVSRYVTKKVTGDQAKAHYVHVDEDGVMCEVEPEYAVMSRRPAIGKGWVERFGESDVFRRDRVVSRGREAPVPRYYDKVLKGLDEARALKVKRKRMGAPRNVEDSTPARLAVREKVERARLTLKKGSL